MRGRTLKELRPFFDIFSCDIFSSEIFSDGFSDGYDSGYKDNILPIRLSFHRVGGGDSSELYKENDFESSSWSLLFSDTSEWESRKRRAGLKQQNPGHPPWQVIIPEDDCAVMMMRLLKTEFTKKERQ